MEVPSSSRENALGWLALWRGGEYGRLGEHCLRVDAHDRVAAGLALAQARHAHQHDFVDLQHFRLGEDSSRNDLAEIADVSGNGCQPGVQKKVREAQDQLSSMQRANEEQAGVPLLRRLGDALFDGRALRGKVCEGIVRSREAVDIQQVGADDRAGAALAALREP